MEERILEERRLMSADDGLDQREIWRHFQERPTAFADAQPRLRFLVKQIDRRRAGSASDVLNVGVGAGYLERLGLRAGWRVHTLDPDASALLRLGSEGVAGTAGLIEEQPFASSSFDFVVVSEVLEHLDPSTGREALREIQRVLRARGWILGSVPHDEDLAAQETVCPRCGLVFHRWGHQTSFDRASLQEVLSRHFDIDEIKVIAFPAREQKGLYGWLKSRVLLRSLLLRLGEPISVPTLYFAARRM